MQEIEGASLEEVARVLFKREFPFYSWENQDKNKQYRYIEVADELVKTLADNQLIIIKLPWVKEKA